MLEKCHSRRCRRCVQPGQPFSSRRKADGCGVCLHETGHFRRWNGQNLLVRCRDAPDFSLYPRQLIPRNRYMERMRPLVATIPPHRALRWHSRRSPPGAQGAVMGARYSRFSRELTASCSRSCCDATRADVRSINRNGGIRPDRPLEHKVITVGRRVRQDESGPVIENATIRQYRFGVFQTMVMECHEFLAVERVPQPHAVHFALDRIERREAASNTVLGRCEDEQSPSAMRCPCKAPAQARRPS